ncbi:hypothetical protein RIF29_30942 [Crotalaria pallida]|uniref:Uncharacterized protein n=1 Tax=Crotalaria pallida TaxID=3830 RepID=A0AAN9EH35_CROPI
MSHTTRHHHKDEPIIDVDEYAPAKVEKGKKKKKRERKEKKNKRTLWICFSNIEVGSNMLNEKIKDVPKNGEFKVKDKIFFSNVKTDEPSKVFSAVENNMRNKSLLSFLICCSNIQVDKRLE